MGFDWVTHSRIEIKANQGLVVKVFKPGASVSKVQPYIGMKIHITYFITYILRNTHQKAMS